MRYKDPFGEDTCLPSKEAFPGVDAAVCSNPGRFVGCSSPGAPSSLTYAAEPGGEREQTPSRHPQLGASLVLSLPEVAVADVDKNSTREASACNGACAVDAQG